MQLRPYQEEAIDAVFKEWSIENKRTLLVLPTGTGKTIVFAKVAEECVRRGELVLILAHRGELLQQAADKIEKTTGLKCSVEKAEQTSIGEWYRITVGSVQTMMREKRLKRFKQDHFKTIIVDEAHHCISESYQKILQYFADSKVLGVTATPDRTDMKNLGSYFDSLAYEYTLPKAIREKYLCPIRAQMIPIRLDISKVNIQAGDYKASDIGEALDPYLEQIARQMICLCRGRKTVVFLPLISTSQKFQKILNEKGMRAAEINGNTENRTEILDDFNRGKYDILCNSMLLTEGWDCPSVDCVIILRPTKSRSLYCQMVGRGTRISPETKKEYLLLLDFLWLTERHELCRPACLICENQEVSERMTQISEEASENGSIDIIEAEQKASKDVQEQREKALAKELEAMRKKKKKLVDPLQFEMSINEEDLSNYRPIFAWQEAPPTDQQKTLLERRGINPDNIEDFGKASMLIEKLEKRQHQGLSTPKQIRFLESRGFLHVGTWEFEEAKNIIDRIAANGWRVPLGINPKEYKVNI